VDHSTAAIREKVRIRKVLVHGEPCKVSSGEGNRVALPESGTRNNRICRSSRTKG